MIQPGLGEESRRFPRHRIDVRLKVSFADGGTNNSAFGRGNNLSQGGMGAYIPCSIPVGSSVALDVRFPYSPVEVNVKAIVRSCQGFRYGLEFVDVTEHVRAILLKNCVGAAT